MSTESLRQVRDHLSEVVDRVEHEHVRVTVTRNGRPAGVLISPDDLAQLEETLEVLGDGGAGGRSARPTPPTRAATSCAVSMPSEPCVGDRTWMLMVNPLPEPGRPPHVAAVPATPRNGGDGPTR